MPSYSCVRFSNLIVDSKVPGDANFGVRWFSKICKFTPSSLHQEKDEYANKISQNVFLKINSRNKQKYTILKAQHCKILASEILASKKKLHRSVFGSSNAHVSSRRSTFDRSSSMAPFLLETRLIRIEPTFLCTIYCPWGRHGHVILALKRLSRYHLYWRMNVKSRAGIIC